MQITAVPANYNMASPASLQIPADNLHELAKLMCRINRRVTQCCSNTQLFVGNHDKTLIIHVEVTFTGADVIQR